MEIFTLEDSKYEDEFPPNDNNFFNVNSSISEMTFCDHDLNVEEDHSHEKNEHSFAPH